MNLNMSRQLDRQLSRRRRRGSSRQHRRFGQKFYHRDFLVTDRIVGNPSDYCKAKLAVKLRSLKVVRSNYDLAASSVDCFSLDCFHQSGSISLLSQFCWDNQMADETGFAPRPTRYATNHSVVGVPQKRSKKLDVRDARCLQVEFINHLFKATQAPRVGTLIN